jgi:antitoxin CptB
VAKSVQERYLRFFHSWCAIARRAAALCLSAPDKIQRARILVAESDARLENEMTSERRQRLGRIQFRSWRRGFREADLVLGPFSDQVAPTLSDAELDQFERLIDEEDQWLYGWIIERDPTPPEFETPVMAKVRAFMRAHVAAEVGKGIG